jgi:hypothetical protein
MARGTNIASVDYNTIRSGIVSILSTGFGQNGYGQKLYSMPVSPGELVTEEQWDSLRIDITNAKLHQDGVTPSIVNVSKGQVIQFGVGHPNNSYSSIINQATLAKFNIAPSRSVVSSKATKSRTGAWNTQLQATLVVTFNGGYTVTNRDLTSFTATGADHARHFFNSGGKIRINSTRTGGVNTPQNNAWTNLLSTIGTQELGAVTPAITNFYTLTNSYQTFYQRSSSTPYSNNFYRLEALCNCTGANNSTGTANTVTFRITWRDDYISPGDLVDGTISVSVSELKASGVLLPDDVFLIRSADLYSFSEITGS